MMVSLKYGMLFGLALMALILLPTTSILSQPGWFGQGQVNEPDTLFDGTARIAIDPNGKPWCVWMGEEARGSPNNIYSATWNGTAWQEELMVSSTDTFCDYAPSIAISEQGTILVAWMRETARLIHDIYYAYWDGTGWVERGTVNTPDTLNDGGLGWLQEAAKSG